MLKVQKEQVGGHRSWSKGCQALRPHFFSMVGGWKVLGVGDCGVSGGGVRGGGVGSDGVGWGGDGGGVEVVEWVVGGG